VDHDLARRIAAFDGIAADETPHFWTPEIVGDRMIEAFDVLARTPGAWRPQGYASTWPGYRQDWADLLDEEAWRNHQKAMEADANRARRRCETDEVSRAEEALYWPAHFLADNPLACDAFLTWASHLATGQSIRATLHRRKQAALALAARMSEAENARRAGMRQELAAKAMTWGNRKLRDARREGDVTAEHRERIRVNATIRLQRDITAADAWPTTIKAVEAMPGRVMARQTAAEYRKRACALLASRLSRAGVVVRLSPPNDRENDDAA
jgi:hypothetical protein